MKKTTLYTLIIMGCTLSCLFASGQAIRTKAPTILNDAGLPATEAIRASTGLISHYVAGAVGSFNAGDQWIGIGQPLASLYGERTQWNGQAFIKALRSQNPAVPAAIKDAIIEWGNQGGEMQFRYITNPLLATGFIKIHTLTSAGNAYYGATAPPIFFGTPKVGISNTNQPGLNSTSTNTASTINGIFRTTSTGPNTYGVGVYSVTNNTSTNNTNYGVLAVTSGAGAGTRTYGVYSNLFAPAGNVNYAIYGNAPVGANSWAGFFQGNTFCTGLYVGSDGNIKVDIKDEENALGKIMKMRAVTYKFDPNQKDLNLPEEEQHGFVAQEVNGVLPEVVKKTRYSIADGDGVEKESKEYLSLNYLGLISILYKGVQEQQAQINELKAKLKEAGIEARSAGTAVTEEKISISAGTFDAKEFTLAQNVPNPFSAQTTIRYNLPRGVKGATIGVFDLNGRMQLQFNGLNGSSQVVIDGNTLQPGIYIYSLLVEGQEVLSKRMVLTR